MLPDRLRDSNPQNFEIGETDWPWLVRTIAETETATENRVGQLGLKLDYVVIAEAIRQWRR